MKDAAKGNVTKSGVINKTLETTRNTADTQLKPIVTGGRGKGS